MSNNKIKGTVKWFSDSKAYGFVNADNDPNTDLFVHYTAIEGDGFKTLAEGQRVAFTLVKDGNRGPQAVNVEKL